MIRCYPVCSRRGLCSFQNNLNHEAIIYTHGIYVITRSSIRVNFILANSNRYGILSGRSVNDENRLIIRVLQLVVIISGQFDWIHELRERITVFNLHVLVGDHFDHPLHLHGDPLPERVDNTSPDNGVADIIHRQRISVDAGRDPGDSTTLAILQKPCDKYA